MTVLCVTTFYKCNQKEMRNIFLFTAALKLKRNDRIVKLNWNETKVSYVSEDQRQNSSWLIQRLLA